MVKGQFTNALKTSAPVVMNGPFTHLDGAIIALNGSAKLKLAAL